MTTPSPSISTTAWPISLALPLKHQQPQQTTLSAQSSKQNRQHQSHTYTPPACPTTTPPTSSPTSTRHQRRPKRRQLHPRHHRRPSPRPSQARQGASRARRFARDNEAPRCDGHSRGRDARRPPTARPARGTRRSVRPRRRSAGWLGLRYVFLPFLLCIMGIG